MPEPGGKTSLLKPADSAAVPADGAVDVPSAEPEREAAVTVAAADVAAGGWPSLPDSG